MHHNDMKWGYEMNEFEKNCARLIRCKFFFLESVEKKNTDQVWNDQMNAVAFFCSLVFAQLNSYTFCTLHFNFFANQETKYAQLIIMNFTVSVCTLNHSCLAHSSHGMERKRDLFKMLIDKWRIDMSRWRRRTELRALRSAHAQPKRFEVVNVFKVN